MTNLNKWITKDYAKEDKTARLKKEFLDNKPFPFLRLENFFIKGKSIEILKALSEEKFYLKESDLLKFKQTKDLISTTAKELINFREFLYSKEFLSFISEITNTKLNNKVDISASLYSNTDFLLCHDDMLESRKIAFMFYLSTFNKKDGGSLNLYASKNNTPTATVKKIIPEFNTFLIFRVSPNSFHSIDEVTSNKKRIAISGWFHG